MMYGEILGKTFLCITPGIVITLTADFHQATDQIPPEELYNQAMHRA